MKTYQLDETDVERMKLFIYELRQLATYMRRHDHPDVERLDHLLARFIASAESDRLLNHG